MRWLNRNRYRMFSNYEQNDLRHNSGGPKGTFQIVVTYWLAANTLLGSDLTLLKLVHVYIMCMSV